MNCVYFLHVSCGVRCRGSYWQPLVRGSIYVLVRVRSEHLLVVSALRTLCLQSCAVALRATHFPHAASSFLSPKCLTAFPVLRTVPSNELTRDLSGHFSARLASADQCSTQIFLSMENNPRTAMSHISYPVTRSWENTIYIYNIYFSNTLSEYIYVNWNVYSSIRIKLLVEFLYNISTIQIISKWTRSLSSSFKKKTHTHTFFFQDILHFFFLLGGWVMELILEFFLPLTRGSLLLTPSLIIDFIFVLLLLVLILVVVDFYVLLRHCFFSFL